MAFASDQPPAATPAIAAPGPQPSSHLHNGAGPDTSTPVSASVSASTMIPPPAHGLTLTNAIDVDNASSTPSLADYKAPPAQVVSDVPAVTGPLFTSSSAAPSASTSASASPSINNFAIRPSHSHSNNKNQNNLSATSRSPAPPSTPGHHPTFLSQGGNDFKQWARSPVHQQMPFSAPVHAPIVHSTAGPGPGPDTGKPSPAVRKSVGFPSPKSEALQTNQKFLDDCDRIKFGIDQALPEAVRRSVRDNWEKCILGSPFHQAFILNASIHHATPAAIQRGMRDFGKTLIQSAKKEIVEQMTTHDLDQLADLILSKASVAFYDRTLEQRLKTIDAKRLINALARAERLGYEVSDVQDEEEDNLEAPASAKVQPPSPQLSSAPVSTPGSVLPSKHPGPIMHCTVCFRRFPALSAYNYHVKHTVCTLSPTSPGGFKYNCQHCGQGFTTPTSLQYHNMNRVCGDFGEPISSSLTKKPTVLVPDATPAQMRTPIPPPSIPSHVATQRASLGTPSAFKTTPPAPSPVGSPSLTGDPYAHLSPEQLAALQSELREAEVAFTERMHQANLIPDPAQKKAKLDGLSNSFGTKQSIIRKKYGVRLRQRRTRAEIQQERDRMQYKTASEIQAEMGVLSKGPGRPAASSYAGYRPAATTNATAVAGAGAASSWAPVNQQQPATTTITTLASNIPVPAPRKPTGSGENNNVSMHGPGSKRRFSGGGETSDSKKHMAYADMGGLSGGAATVEAETLDPTLLPPINSNNKGGGLGGTKEEPMALDDSSSEESDGSDSDSADEDIPAELPASVKQTLVRSSPAGGEGGRSRGGSSSAAAGI